MNWKAEVIELRVIEEYPNPLPKASTHVANGRAAPSINAQCALLFNLSLIELLSEQSARMVREGIPCFPSSYGPYRSSFGVY